MDPIIIFGPTGAVGSAAALSAHSFGASSVVLAMRNPAKPIPGLTPDFESAHAFRRVQADLSDPSTLAAAASSTGAKRAFLYIDHASTDSMLSAARALKEGGIAFVVFLSTGGIRGDLHAVDPTDVITFSHARVELTLQEVFGADNVVPIRPGFFASNSFWWKKAIASGGPVRIFAPQVKMDWITPGDIGRVAASVLVQGTKPGYKEAIWLVGPQKTSVREGASKIAKAATGKEAEIVEIGPEEGVQMYVENGVPSFVAKGIIENFGKLAVLQGNGGDWLRPEDWEAGSKAVEAYTGKPATRLEEWIEENKHHFRG